MDKTQFTPSATGFPPVLNLHTANKQYDSKGLTKDDALGEVVGAIKDFTIIVKAGAGGEGDDEEKRIHVILQLDVESTNVLKTSDGAPIQKGKAYTLYCDGNLPYNLGIKTKRKKLPTAAGSAEIAAWLEEHAGQRVAIDYKGGTPMTKGQFKNTKSHNYEVGWPVKK